MCIGESICELVRVGVCVCVCGCVCVCFVCVRVCACVCEWVHGSLNSSFLEEVPTGILSHLFQTA